MKTKRMRKYTLCNRAIVAIATMAALLSAGNGFAQYALKEWGENSSGQIGNNTFVKQLTPHATEAAPVNGSKFFTASMAGGYIMAIREDGSLWGWGANYQAQLGMGARNSGYNYIRMSHAGGGVHGKWIRVAACYNHTVAIREDGSLWGWGSRLGVRNGYVDDDIIVNAVQLDKGSGNKWIEVAGSGDMASFGGISRGWAAAIRVDGKLFTWGTTAADGILAQGTPPVYDLNYLTPVVDVSNVPWVKVTTSNYFALGIRKDGSLWGWGSNASGELGLGDSAIRREPVMIDPGTNTGMGGKWIVVSAGSSHVAAIREDGSLWAWGTNEYGQLGDGTTNGTPNLKRIDNGTNGKWVQVVAGYDFTLGMKADGTIWGWGTNRNGNMGNGTDVSSPGTQFYTPQQITSLGTVQPSSTLLVANSQTSFAALLTEKGVAPPTCYAPSLKMDSISTTTGRVVWVPIPGIHYEVALDQSATASPTGTVTTQTDTFFNASGLTPGAPYYFHIRTNCGNGNYSRWDTIAFMAAPPCPKPTGITADMIAHNSADIYWDNMPRSTEYEVVVDQSATKAPTGTKSVTVDTFFFAAQLDPATTYYVHVRNHCGGGNYSDWDTISFRTLSNCIGTNTLFVGNVNSTSADVSWSGIATAADYDVAVDQSPTLAPTGTVVNQATTQYSAASLTPNTLYYAHVRAHCGGNDRAAWDTISFRTLNAPNNINRVVQAKEITLYPNPVTSILQVQSPIMLQGEVYSMDGRLLMTIDNTEKGIDFSHISSGVYIVKLIDAEGKLLKTQRIVR